MLMQPTAGPLTVDDFHRLGELGVYGEDDRVELIHGRVVPMTPIGPRHAGCVRRLITAFARLTGGRITMDAQGPFVADAQDEPQPDLLLLRLRHDGYAATHPGPGDVLLLVEVADSSLTFDRDTKMPLYASAGIAEVWLVSLPGDTVTVYRDPRPAGYASVRPAHRGESLVPLLLPDISLSVTEILG